MHSPSIFQVLVSHFGSQAKLARALGITPMAISHWKQRGVPVRQAVRIEQITMGSLQACDLCPEVFTSGGREEGIDR